MHYRYERICIEAGCDEKTTKRIRNYLNSEAQRLHRQRALRDKNGLVFNHLSAFVNEDGEEIEFEDTSVDFEEQYYHEEDIKKLRRILDTLPAEDREFLLRIYGGSYGELSRMSKETGIPRSTLDSRKEKLLSILRKKMK